MNVLSAREGSYLDVRRATYISQVGRLGRPGTQQCPTRPLRPLRPRKASASLPSASVPGLASVDLPC